MRITPLSMIGLLFSLTLIGGCYEASDVTVHEPGEYKGKRDPLLQRDARDRAETLAKRFRRVQTDR